MEIANIKLQKCIEIINAKFNWVRAENTRILIEVKAENRAKETSLLNIIFI